MCFQNIFWNVGPEIFWILLLTFLSESFFFNFLLLQMSAVPHFSGPFIGRFPRNSFTRYQTLCSKRLAIPHWSFSLQFFTHLPGTVSAVPHFPGLFLASASFCVQVPKSPLCRGLGNLSASPIHIKLSCKILLLISCATLVFDCYSVNNRICCSSVGVGLGFLSFCEVLWGHSKEFLKKNAH